MKRANSFFFFIFKIQNFYFLLGRVTRTLCFSRASTCNCELSSEITITNCGDFFVYRRRSRDFPHCLARACTVPHTTENNKKGMDSFSLILCFNAKKSLSHNMCIVGDISLDILLLRYEFFSVTI